MGPVMKSRIGSVSGAMYTTTVIESPVTPLAVAPPLSATLAKHSWVKKYGIAILPVDWSHLSENVRSVRLPFWLKGMAPAGSAAAPLDEDAEPDDVDAVFLSSLPLETMTTTAMMAITTTMPTIGPQRRWLLPPPPDPSVALLGCMVPIPST